MNNYFYNFGYKIQWLTWHRFPEKNEQHFTTTTLHWYIHNPLYTYNYSAYYNAKYCSFRTPDRLPANEKMR